MGAHNKAETCSKMVAKALLRSKISALPSRNASFENFFPKFSTKTSIPCFQLIVLIILGKKIFDKKFWLNGGLLP